MLYLVISILLLLSIFLYYRFSYKPRALIKHYEKLLKELGYRTYVQPFQVFGISFFEINKKNVILHNDAQYDERTIFPQVDVIIGNVFDKTFLVFIEPSVGKELLSAEKVNIYPKQKNIIEGVKLIIGEGMVFTQGDPWKNKRKLMSKVFNFDLIRENIPKIVQICDRSFKDYEKDKTISQSKCKYDVSKLSALIFSEIMLKCFLGSSNQVKIEGISFSQFALQLITEAGLLSMKPYFVLLGRFAYKFGLTKQVRQIKKKVNLFRAKAAEILHARVKQVQEAPIQLKCTDVVQALVYENMNNKSEFSYSENGLLDELSTFLVAGTDTTTFFFTMMVYFLGKYPKVQEKLRKQIDQVIKTDSNEEITFQNLKKLNYIDWIQLETTRHYGPANGIFFRQATEDNYLLNVPIKKETILGFQPRGSHYNPKYFKEPNEFRPERWESECDNLNPYAFLGFGGGPRSCIGKQLALLESKIALVKLIKRYESIEVPESLTFIQSMLYQPLSFETTFTKSQKE